MHILQISKEFNAENEYVLAKTGVDTAENINDSCTSYFQPRMKASWAASTEANTNLDGR